MLALQPATHWHDKTFGGMENDPPPKRRRLTESGRSSTASVPTSLGWGWISESALAPEGVTDTSTPSYPTIFTQSYWSRPPENPSTYQQDYSAALSAHASRYSQSGNESVSEGYAAYSPQDLEWQGLDQADTSLVSRSEHVPPQSAGSDPGIHRYYSQVSQPASSTSWDVMRSTPSGPQYEYLDAFTRACQQSQGNFAPYVDAPVLRSNLHMGSRTSMPPPAQPQPNPVRARQILASFDEHLESSFDSLQADNLSVAADDLLEASTLLLENTSELRLYQDNLDGNEPQPDWRRRRRDIWHNFNTAWLAVLNKQMMFCEQERTTGVPVQPPRSRISRDSLARIGLQLRTLADMIHEQGLVDYEQGFDEDRISELFETCMDLMNELEGPGTWTESASASAAAGAGAGGAAGSSSNPSQQFYQFPQQ